MHPFFLSIHTLLDTGNFHVLPIRSNVAINMGGQLSLWDSNSISFGSICRSGVTGSYGSSIFNFLSSLHRIFHSDFYSPTNSAWSFSFLYIFNPLSLVFLAKAIIIVEWWYFIMVLTWIFFFFFFLTLQYFIGFAIYQHESTTGIHMFPILNPPPSSLPIPSLWVVQCTSPKHPVSCIKPGLATHFIYDIIHVSMPYSQIIPPSPSPKESKRLFYNQCLFCCLIYRVIVTIFLNSIYMH